MAEQHYSPREGTRPRRSVEEVYLDVSRNCNERSCVFSQYLSLNRIEIRYPRCSGRQANDGCPIKREALQIGMNSRDAVLGYVLAALKFNLGDLVQEDVRALGAKLLFDSLGLRKRFDEVFEAYMHADISITQVYPELMRETTREDLVAKYRAGRDEISRFNHPMGASQDYIPGSWFG